MKIDYQPASPVAVLWWTVVVADFVLPLWWAMGATIPIFAFSWWLAYRSEWF